MNAKSSFGYFTHLLTINILADISMYVTETTKLHLILTDFDNKLLVVHLKLYLFYIKQY